MENNTGSPVNAPNENMTTTYIAAPKNNEPIGLNMSQFD